MKTVTLSNNKIPFHWSIQEYLENQPFHFFKPVLRSHKKLQLKYSLLAVELNEHLKKSPNVDNEPTFRSKIMNKTPNMIFQGN